MKTAKEILNRSLTLLGEEAGENTESFEQRAVTLINVLLSQISVLNEAAPEEAVIVPQIKSLEDQVGGEDAIALSLLPLGLAALLIGEEDENRSAFFLTLYQNERERLRLRSRKGRRHKIRRSF